MARLLRARGFRVFLTRTRDATVSIEKRIAKVNRCCSADLLVSVHANSAPNSACGVETFCSKPSLFFREVSMLNAKHQKIVSQYNLNLYKKGASLAQLLQEHVLSSVHNMNSRVVDRGVKHAVPRLLLGTEIPGALIEVGFLSNRTEAVLLKDPNYQFAIAKGVCGAIAAYFGKSYG